MLRAVKLKRVEVSSLITGIIFFSFWLWLPLVAKKNNLHLGIFDLKKKASAFAIFETKLFPEKWAFAIHKLLLLLFSFHMSCFGLSGKFVVVTGSTAGIGKACAAAFAKNGATVVINGRSLDSCHKAIDALVADTKADKSLFVPIPGDVSNKAGAEKFVADITAVGRPVDVLVNNVGIFQVKPFFDIDDDKWQEYFDVNIMSGVRLCRPILKQMLDRNSGKIVFISSEVGMRPLPHMVPYSATKAMQINLARGLAEMTKGTNVTVNSVLPGPTMTEGVKVYMEGFAKEKGIPSFDEAVAAYFKEYETTSLLQRFLTPEEVANTVLFLGSELGNGVNGHAQQACGGIIRHI